MTTDLCFWRPPERAAASLLSAVDKCRRWLYNIAMILTDVHTHSTFSSDGQSSLDQMAAAARAKGLRYFGVSEHFDCDYMALGLPYEDGSPAYTDAEGYFAAARALQRQNDGSFTLLAGCEFGYTDHPAALRRYDEIVKKYSPDFIVNSVHTVDGADGWYAEYFAGKDKRTAYSRYLKRVLQSLSAPYPFDIVGHIGYVSRNAPYADPKLRYEDFRDIYDDILGGIISMNKILEVNSSARGAGSAFLPDTDVLARYYALGGRLVSFASDAHSTDRIAQGREEAVAALRAIGFRYVTVPVKGSYMPVEL